MLVKPLIHKALIIKSYFIFILPEEPEELEEPKKLEDELVEEPRESVSDSLVELALDTLCWSKSDL